MAKHSKYQQKIIRNFYDNREQISLQRVQELVTDIFLTEGKKRAQHWRQLANHLEKLGVKKDTIDHLVAKDDPSTVVEIAEKIMKKKDL